MIRTFTFRCCMAAIAFLTFFASQQTLRAQGVILTGVGPVNRSMGGAGTAAPLDSITALHWNPGSISALPTSEVSFGFEALLADIDLQPTVGGVTSKTSSEPGFGVGPSIGWVHHLEGTPATIGLGIFTVAGFRNNMPRDTNNPLLANGPAFADAEIFQMAPTISFALSDNWSVGFAPTLTAAKLTVNPLGPSVITPDGLQGQGNRLHWGGGAQVGLYYVSDNCVHLGFSIKSPQWFEDFRFMTDAGVVTWDLDYPMILSLGAAYSGWENWVFAMDARYIDYDNTAGFSDLGFSNIFAGALGAQYRFNESLHLRFGYNFNQNPISSGDAATNVFTPLIQEQNVAVGASYRLARNVDINLSYVYLIENSLTGPLPAPFGPGDKLRHEITAHSLILGVTARY